MSNERTRRIARNEALYRQLNERIEEIKEASGARGTKFEIVCECGKEDCTEMMVVSYAVYERTRANSARFLVKPGHEEPDLATVVEEHRGYVVSEKVTAEARRLAEHTDPRS